jgi:hypothetical protein
MDAIRVKRRSDSCINVCVSAVVSLFAASHPALPKAGERINWLPRPAECRILRFSMRVRRSALSVTRGQEPELALGNRSALRWAHVRFKARDGPDHSPDHRGRLRDGRGSGKSREQARQQSGCRSGSGSQEAGTRTSCQSRWPTKFSAPSKLPSRRSRPPRRLPLPGVGDQLARREAIRVHLCQGCQLIVGGKAA